MPTFYFSLVVKVEAANKDSATKKVALGQFYVVRIKSRKEEEKHGVDFE